LALPRRAGWVSTPLDPAAPRLPLRVQRAMMRLAAARADIVAVLGTPGWMDEAQALRHAGALARIARLSEDEAISAGVFAPDEQRVPSFGALYHPWLGVAPAEAGAARWIAPEGPACGVIARRALTRGAWVAPANEVVQDALSLRSPPGVAALPLFHLGVNLWQSDGLRVRAMGARTLSGQADWVPLNVRRLIQLLRRLLLREGATWVFEPHGGALHRAVERGLTAWLGLLHSRGAFAGRRPAEAWQLVVDGSRADDGRLEIELRVAPSRPMEFIAVRLVHKGDRLSALEI
jgi:phage tail sheath protein FI